MEIQESTVDNKVDIIKLMLKGLKPILTSTICITLLITIVVLLSPNVYRSEATLIPANESTGKIPGQIGGLAALAGVNIGTLTGNDKYKIAIEKMKSREFIGKFIGQYDLAVEILAGKGEDEKTGELIIDAKLYDIERKLWIRDVSYPKKQIPSVLELYEAFSQKLNINEDKTNNTIKISFESYSPKFSKFIVENLIKEINKEIQYEEIIRAEKNIEYLERKIESIENKDARKMLYNLIEEQTKTLMLANINEEYVLKTIDKAFVPEKKIKPNRLLLIFLGFFGGGLISCILYILIKQLSWKK